MVSGHAQRELVPFCLCGPAAHWPHVANMLASWHCKPPGQPMTPAAGSARQMGSQKLAAGSLSGLPDGGCKHNRQVRTKSVSDVIQIRGHQSSYIMSSTRMHVWMQFGISHRRCRSNRDLAASAVHEGRKPGFAPGSAHLDLHMAACAVHKSIQRHDMRCSAAYHADIIPGYAVG